MDGAHGTHTPVGWPATLAARLLEQGVPMEFGIVFVTQFDHLPARAEELWHHLRLSDDPDVVIVSIGGIYTRRIVLPDTPRFLRLRNDVGRRLGRHAFAAFRPMRPLVGAFGHQLLPYTGTDDLERFVGVAREAWPAARVLVPDFTRRIRGPSVQRRIAERVTADVRAACGRAGVEHVDLNPILAEPRLRCANSYNLSTEGSRLAGEYLAARLAGSRSEALPAGLQI